VNKILFRSHQTEKYKFGVLSSASKLLHSIKSPLRLNWLSVVRVCLKVYVLAILMQQGDIAVYKVDAGGIGKLGYIEIPQIHNPNKQNTHPPIADFVIMVTDDKPVIYAFEPKGRVHIWEIIIK
jgi:hypothetical protein